MNSPKKLYALLALLSLGGYAYLVYQWQFSSLEASKQTLCVFKVVTDVPCPSCGSTRSILAILKGNLIQGFTLNPLGYLLLAALLVMPFWIVGDVLSKKESLFLFVHRITNKIAQRPYNIIMMGLVVLNWIWNINKGL